MGIKLMPLCDQKLQQYGREFGSIHKKDRSVVILTVYTYIAFSGYSAYS